MLEIERKFLVKPEFWQPTNAGEVIAQGYLCALPERTVRVRIRDKRGYLTVKGKNQGISRAEYEYEIPVNEAEELLLICEQPLLSKRRYVENFDGFNFEVDVFAGANAPLILAEIELAAPDSPFPRPPWLGQEVSDDARYFNSYLARHPFGTW